MPLLYSSTNCGTVCLTIFDICAIIGYFTLIITNRYNYSPNYVKNNYDSQSTKHHAYLDILEILDLKIQKFLDNCLHNILYYINNYL